VGIAHGEGVHAIGPSVPRLHAAAVLGVYPVAQANVQVVPLLIWVFPAPQVNEAALATVTADMRQGSGSQVKAGSTPEVAAPQTGLAVLGVYPGRQAAVQADPAAIEVSGENFNGFPVLYVAPQAPVKAWLATFGTVHWPVELWHVGVVRDPKWHVTVCMLGVNAVGVVKQTTEQLAS
jgi:hypothetical protein